MVYRVLTIAGSDSGGGAGIQADLKTFQELGTYGMSVITALTAQNTLGVHGVYPQTVQAVEAQLEAVLSDIGVDAVKTGMLFSAEIIEAVAQQLKAYQVNNIVVDPVMVAKGGQPLLQQEAIEALRTALVPLATVITPNIPEAEVLIGQKGIQSLQDMEEAARAIQSLGVQYVILKGGHLEDEESVDVVYDGQSVTYLRANRVKTKHTHGTGCTFAAAIAAGLAKGQPVLEAARVAKDFVTCAIEHALEIGQGIGPTHHGAYRQVHGQSGSVHH
ncbi:hydroxymethylpyrimidine/phosphomethylpyrimidine kinase [Caldalkalibacillus thermarum]|uniref:bifunctional hydroxymethylpyrimidine kinase/phosphomethylpyrimidine kinase n=1 Tax=Caldalkalibacillus thermarum TaxID=296745 RepID=UPI001666821F|nr:bifunctional hydroxymethylpyrimidine kinase/phosphomethylpyrimidine kinase [Caldalkalibacillus thermarum]GGK20301.1 hydroxymethylpyrimidine/phosphomethylpyrimidine kinase [Caldalkalibacillus thermarum]